jgi:tetratricopeptide (TPR) repeat protein
MRLWYNTGEDTTMENKSDRNKPGNLGEPPRPEEQQEIKASDYLRAVRTHLRNGKIKDAYSFLLQANVQYPEDPLILSYYGYLQAVVDKKFRSGVENCKRAILLLKEQGLSSEKVPYSVFYLNLGRAFVAAGRKKDAIDALKKGLKYDSGNIDLKKELQGLGERKQPPVPFLDRTNPINKYIGMILKSEKKAPPKGKSGGRGR